MKMRFVSIGGFALAILSLGCSYRSNSQVGTQSLFPDDVTGDAEKTYAAYVRAVNAGTEKRDTDIPPAYWAERIKALHPLKVYTHRVNIVVVQKTSRNVEEGKYIHIGVSSYLPDTGDDGFVFTPNPRTGDKYNLGNGIFYFKRTTTI